MADTVIDIEKEKREYGRQAPAYTRPTRGITIGAATMQTGLDEKILQRMNAGNATLEDIKRLRNIDSFMAMDREAQRSALNKMSLDFYQLTENPQAQDRIINQISGEITPQSWFEQQQAKGKTLQAKVQPYLHKALPVIGDIAATMAVPELKAVQGLSMPARFVRNVGQVAKKATASGAGSAAGEAAAQVLGGEELDPKRIRNEALLGAGIEGGFGAVGQAARGMGNILSKTTLLGSFVEKQAMEEAIQETVKDAQKALKEYGLPRIGSKTTAGLGVGEEFGKRLDFGATFEDYNKLLNSEWVGDTIQMNKTADVLKQMMAAEKASAVGKIGDKAAIKKSLGLKSAEYRDVLERITVNNELDTKTAKYLLDQIWKEGKSGGTFGKLMPLQDTARKELKDALLYDLDNAAPGVWDLKDAADTFYGQAVNFLKSNQVAKQWMQKLRSGATLYEAKPEQFVDELFSTNATEDLTKFKDFIQKTQDGKDAWEALKYHWIDDIYQKNMSMDKISGEMKLFPAMLANDLMEKRPMIQRLMPEILPKVDREIEKYVAITPTFMKKNLEREGFWGMQRVFAPTLAGVFSVYAVPAAEILGGLSALAITKPPVAKLLKRGEAAIKYPVKAGSHLISNEMNQ